MSRIMGKFECWFWGAVCLIPFFVSAVPSSLRPEEWQTDSLPQKGSSLLPSYPAKGDSERRPDTVTISVMCHPDRMVIEMNADLFGVGVPVDSEDVRLGKSEQTNVACRAAPTEPAKYTVTAALTDCGTERSITDDYLIYTNTLEYSPRLSPDGLVRSPEASFPIQCFYKRKFDMGSIPVVPTWIPFMSTHADEGQLDFSLKLMTDDWAFKRASNVYFLGDVINIEASVKQFSHTPMRVFVDHCVATVTPDPDSIPRYAFIEHDGCMMDGFLTGSSSQFLPRVQYDKLHIQLDAFMFHQEGRAELYITCLLRAEPAEDSDSMSRACSFIDNGWQSADDEDWLCDGCLQNGAPAQSPSSNQKGSARDQAGSGGPSPQTQQLKPRTGLDPTLRQEQPSQGWQKEECIGPISVLKKSKMPLAPPPQPMPETERATSVKPVPRGHSPMTNTVLPKELSRPDPKDFLPALKSSGIGLDEFFDMWLKRTSPKDWTEMMARLLTTPLPPPLADTDADPATEAPVTEAPVTEAPFMPVLEQADPTLAVMALTPDVVSTSSLAPSNEEDDGKR